MRRTGNASLARRFKPWSRVPTRAAVSANMVSASQGRGTPKSIGSSAASNSRRSRADWVARSIEVAQTRGKRAHDGVDGRRSLRCAEKTRRYRERLIAQTRGDEQLHV